MQSRYGGVSEMQQFLVDGCAPTLFTISPVPSLPPANPSADIHAHHHHHHHPGLHNIHPQPQQLLPSPTPPSHFPHFHHHGPITQQLFQQPHHQFQLFHHSHPNPHHQHPPEPRRLLPHHQLGMGRESAAPENSTSPIRIMGATGASGSGPSFLAPSMNFKLVANDSGSREGLNDEDGILQDDEGSESRFHPWQKEEESSIKEPFWRPLDLDYINRDSKDKEPETSTNTYSKRNKGVNEQAHGNNPTSGSNYKLFSELEAIYKPGGGGGGGGGGNNQTGSGSALTGDENPILTTAAPGIPCDQHGAGSRDHASDTSTGGGEPLLPSKFVKGSGRKKRKRRHQQQHLSSIAVFFEGLVKQLMDHQESLHRKFLEVMEKRDQERMGHEEAWRRQEAAKSSGEATARAQERALAAAREAAIISFLEKMTGESLNLPTKAQFQSQLLEEFHKDDSSINPLEPAEDFNNSNAQLNTSRWPRVEVQALIQVRSGLESKFQEPGLKGPLWEEVSASMAALGYYRSSKRCKEKWENINKYFRKTKDSGKKRPQQSKTCPYFHQLDQLYSKPSINKGLLPSSSSSPNHAAPAGERRDNSELLAPADTPNNFSFPELGYLENDYSSKKGDNNAEATSGAIRNDEDDECENREDEERERRKSKVKEKE